MNVLRIRNEMRSGKTIFDLPLRVTFYARVSTDKDEQINSLENQIQYYTELIQSKPNWTYIEGYIDEGISGTSTKKRDSFNRMIRDAKAGRFDFIITKEISRFSRSTLDSIKYTQELLEHDVGVLFQNDNINTLDSDSEFRLVVMAGVAQDEVRKLSERLKFGFRQAIKNGHVLGNDKLWGYDKKDCVLTINEEEAQVVRRIFDLYANQQMGIRRISQTLYDEGFTSRKGNTFNVLTIRHILCNPKYKGWYCANKSQTVDYRSKRKVFLDESEWVMYPDPSIPAIVSEELWDRANALYKRRSQQMMSHQSAAKFHNRYPYSGKIICEEHGTSFHRQVLRSSKGEKEVWQCRVYRNRGRVACSAPQLRTTELDQIMAQIFDQLTQNKQAIIDAVVTVLQSVPDEHDYAQDIRHIEEDLSSIQAKKDRLLEMSIEGVISTAEFKQRNDGFNEQAKVLEERLAVLQSEAEKGQQTTAQLQEIRSALEEELTFQNSVNSAVVTTILDKIIVKKGSTKEELHLEIHLKFGGPCGVVFNRENSSFRFNPCLTEQAKGRELWKAKGQASFRDYGRNMVCHYSVIWDGSFKDSNRLD
ncbi:recombinase family protein [Flintibacter muris]|uniref:recombinase family protein n=1 Tax=Flintibacter muris TaxID=2941327 RepID=UPI00203A5BF4|nr:recombinase family protein [Flintibacter muris]